MFLEAGLCSMVMSLLQLEFRSSLFRFSLKLPKKYVPYLGAKLGGGNSKIPYFHPKHGEMIQFDEHVFGWLKPPTSKDSAKIRTTN